MKKEIQIKWQDDQIIINGFNELVEVLSKTKEVRCMLVEGEQSCDDEASIDAQLSLFDSVVEDFVEVNEQKSKRYRSGCPEFRVRCGDFVSYAAPRKDNRYVGLFEKIEKIASATKINEGEEVDKVLDKIYRKVYKELFKEENYYTSKNWKPQHVYPTKKVYRGNSDKYPGIPVATIPKIAYTLMYDPQNISNTDDIPTDKVK